MSLQEEKRTQRKDGHVETEAEIGVMWPQAKEHEELPETGGGKEGFSPRAFGGSVALVAP